jgi:hypothetical protein
MAKSAGRTGRDFSDRVIRDLRERVAFMCSNPLCRRLTVKAAFEGNKPVRSGKAAHILSAGKAGPRSKEGMDDKECCGFDNGLWLCDACARLIDDDESKYPPDLLQKWKLDAEEYVRELVTQDTRLRQLQGMVSPMLSALRILTAVPGPGARFDQTFEPPGSIGIARMLIESEQLVFERGFQQEANLIKGIGDELNSIYTEIRNNTSNAHLDISTWKDEVIRTVMIAVMRFSEESYNRYKETESGMVINKINAVRNEGQHVRPCETAHSPDGTTL